MKETPIMSSEKQEAKKCAACGSSHATTECTKLKNFSQLSEGERKSFLTKLSRVEDMKDEDIQSSLSSIDESGRQALIMEISYTHGLKTKPEKPESYEDFRKRPGNVLTMIDLHDPEREIKSRVDNTPIDFDRDWGQWIMRTHSVGLGPEVDMLGRTNPIRGYVTSIKKNRA